MIDYDKELKEIKQAAKLKAQNTNVQQKIKNNATQAAKTSVSKTKQNTEKTTTTKSNTAKSTKTSTAKNNTSKTSNTTTIPQNTAITNRTNSTNSTSGGTTSAIVLKSKTDSTNTIGPVKTTTQTIPFANNRVKTASTPGVNILPDASKLGTTDTRLKTNSSSSNKLDLNSGLTLPSAKDKSQAKQNTKSDMLNLRLNGAKGQAESGTKNSYINMRTDERAELLAKEGAEEKKSNDALLALVKADRGVEKVQKQIEKYTEKEYKDNALGTFASNYDSGRIAQDLYEAANDYINNPNSANQYRVEQLYALQQHNQEVNEKVGSGNVITKDLAQYLPQAVDQAKAVIDPDVIAAGVMVGAVAGPMAGYKAAQTLSNSKYSYDTMRGAAYLGLIEDGVDSQTAIKAASNEGFISSLIEGAETLVSFGLLGIDSILTNVGRNGVSTILKGIGEKAAQKPALALAKALAGYGVNIASEYLEESTQEAVSIANEKTAGQGIIPLAKEAVNTYKNFVTGSEDLTDEERQRMSESGRGGAVLGALLGAIPTAVNVNQNVQAMRNQNANAQVIPEAGTVQNDTAQNLNTLPYANAQATQNQQNIPEAGTTAQTVQNNQTIPNAPVQNAQTATQTIPEAGTNQQNEEANNNQQKTRDMQFASEEERQTYIAEKNKDFDTKEKRIASNYTNETQEKIFDAISKRSGTQIVFDVGVNGNGSYQGGVIRINPEETSDPVYTVLRHELTHHIENSKLYGNFQKFIIREARRKGVNIEYQLEQIKKDYAEEWDRQNIKDREAAAKSEFTAKFVAQYLFDDNEAIERLAREEPSTARKILEWLQDTVTILKSYTQGEEGKYIRFYTKAQRKFERALNTVENVESKPEQYSAYGEKGANNLNDTDSLEEAKRLYNEKKSADEIFEQTGWYLKQDGKWAKKFSDFDSVAYPNGDAQYQNNSQYKKYIKLKEEEKTNTLQYKLLGMIFKKADEKAEIGGTLEDFLKHDTLFKAYPELRNAEVKYDDNMPESVAAYTVNGESVRIRRGATPEEIIYDLTHEDQHLIQGQEHTEPGGSPYKYNGNGQGIKAMSRETVQDLIDGNDSTFRTLYNRAKITGNQDALMDYIDRKMLEKYNLKSYDEADEYGYAYLLGEMEASDVQSDLVRDKEEFNTHRPFFTYLGERVLLQNKDITDWNGNPIAPIGGGKNGFNSLLPQERINGNQTSAQEGSQASLLSKSTGQNVRNSNLNEAANEAAFSLQKNTSNIEERKQQQLDIISRNNPKDGTKNKDATWITSVDDIQTWNEAMHDEWSGEQDVTPDFKWEDALKAEKTGYITVYSSKPIKAGSFVTPSRMLAESYGSENPYSKRIKVDDAAWIDMSEGQYAPIGNGKGNTQYSLGSKLEGNTEEEQKALEKLKTNSSRRKKFTAVKNVEAAKDLIAVHNVFGSDLEKSLELGGLPMPSIAIIKAEQGHNMFGDISLVFDKDSIDPEVNKNNRIYNGDAYTPTFPTVYSKLNEDVQDRISKWAYDLQRRLPEDSRNALYKFTSGLDEYIDRAGSVENFIDSLKNDNDLKQAYLVDSGKEAIPAQYKTETINTVNDVNRKFFESLINNSSDLLNAFGTIGQENEESFEKQNYENIIDAMINAFEDGGRTQKQAEDMVYRRGMSFWMKKLRSAYDYMTNGITTETRQTKDFEATNKAIEDAVDQEDYDKWLQGKLSGVVEKQGIWNGKSAFNNDGSRKSWEARHYELNLENVVKVMSNQSDQGLGGFGMKSIFGGSAEKLNSIPEVKSREYQLKTIPEDEYKQMRSGFSDRYYDLTHNMVKSSNSLAADDASNVLIDGLVKYKTKSALNSYYKREFNGWANYNETVLDDFLNLVNEIRQMPTGYFEAKPKRAVEFNEVKAAIVPSDTDQDLIKQLEDYGTEVITYKAGDEEDRKAKLNSLDRLKFQKGSNAFIGQDEEEQQALDKLSKYAYSGSTGKYNELFTLPYATEEARQRAEASRAMTSIPEAPKKKTQTLPQSKVDKTERKAVRQFTNDMLTLLGATKYDDNKLINQDRRNILEDLKNDTLTEEKMETYFSDIFDNALEEDMNYVDKYSSMRQDISDTRLILSDRTKKNITDFSKRRNKDFKTFNFVNEGERGIAIDEFYQEMQEMYPGEFKEVNTPEEMLEELSKKAKKYDDAYTKVNAAADGDQIREESWQSFQNEIEELKKKVEYAEESRKEKLLKKANKDKKFTIEDTNAYVERINGLKKDARTITSNVLLNDQDALAVENLLNGRYTEDYVRDNYYYADNILTVYEAKKAVRDAQAEVRANGARMKQELSQDADALVESADLWKDKRNPISYRMETAERNMEDITDKATAKRLNEYYFTPVHQHEAERTRDVNNFKQQVKDLEISTKPEYTVPKGTNMKDGLPDYDLKHYMSKDKAEEIPGLREQLYDTNGKISEAALVQLYGEKLIDKGQIRSLGADPEKIINAANTLRGIYDQLFNDVNDQLITYGYDPLERTKNYMPHFSTDRPETMLGKIANKLGFSAAKNTLPSDIAGLTEGFKPGKKWWGNLLHRTGPRTEYDAVEGFERYVEGATDIIYHTEDIQKLRQFETSLRYKFGEKGFKEQMQNLQLQWQAGNLSDQQYEAEQNRLMDQGVTSHQGLINWVRDYTDTLAGKKSYSDRALERDFSRGFYDMTNKLEGRIAANMVGINPASWLTNFVPLVQGGSVSYKNVVRGMAETMSNLVRNDDFVNESDFLTNRRGTETINMSAKDKVINIMTSPMELIDNFVSESLTRAMYDQYIDKGLGHEEAIAKADRFAADTIADRSKGAQPTIFNAKNPIMKIFTQFQIEASNQWSHFFKDIPRNSDNVASTALAFTRLAVGAYIFNDVYESLVGRRPALDFLSWINDFSKDAFGIGMKNFADAIKDLLDKDDDDDKKFLDNFIETTTKQTGAKTVEDLGENIVQDIPYVGGLLEGGRYPISSVFSLDDAKEVATTAANVISGDTSLKKGLRTIGEDLEGPLLYTIPPVGGGQIKKVGQAVNALINGGVYGLDSEGKEQLKYATDRDIGNAVKGILFGRYAMGNASDYLENGYKSLSAKKTDVYNQLVDSGMKPEETEDIMKSIDTSSTQKLIDSVNATGLSADRKNLIVNELKSTDKDLDLTNEDTIKYSMLEDKTRDSIDELVENEGLDLHDAITVTEAFDSESAVRKVLDVVNTGLDTESAINLYNNVYKYNDAVSKTIEAMNSDDYSEEVRKALGLADYAVEKAEYAYKAGVTADSYQKMFDSSNENGDSYVNQTEAKAYLDKQKNMSKEVKRWWWKALTGGSDKNNPY